VVVRVRALGCVMRLKHERVNQITGDIDLGLLDEAWARSLDQEQGMCVARIRV
jgi:hypothetical protein